MTSKFLRYVLATTILAVCAWAQTSSPAAPAGSSAPPAAGPASQPPVTLTGTKVGTINIERAVFATNEGGRDFDALQKKLEPKQNELKSQNDELEGLQKQLQTQGDKLNEDARANLVKQIETKKKSFDRAYQDAQDDAQNQQKEIFGRVLAKMAPMIVKFAQDNGYGLILDTSQTWPQSPVVIAGEGVDITKAVVDIYNAQSGVPAPTSGAARPAPKPTTGATTKPAPAKPSEPSK